MTARAGFGEFGLEVQVDPMKIDSPTDQRSHLLIFLTNQLYKCVLVY